jgi:hypothetical protein
MNIATGPAPDKQSKENGESEKPRLPHDEIDSDGSASAFSASELLPEPPREKKKNTSASDPDPSGNEDY